MSTYVRPKNQTVLIPYGRVHRCDALTFGPTGPFPLPFIYSTLYFIFFFVCEGGPNCFNLTYMDYLTLFRYYKIQ